MGMTSYRLVKGRFQQSRTTQAYAVVLNVALISTLPLLFWDVAKGMMISPWLPRMMFITPFILYMVNCAVIAYILISRFYRDSMLIDLLDLTNRVTRKMELAGRQTCPQLRRLLHLKSFTFAYLTLGSLGSLVFLDSGFLEASLINMGYSILNLTTFFYFSSFWQVARGYDFVNQQLEKRTLEEEIRNLWSLHLLLSRMAQRINRIYGVQMLVSRLDYIIFTTVYGYVGMIVLHEGITPFIFHAILIYIVRTADFFLNDFICELTIRCQCYPKHETSEGKMSQEVSYFSQY